MLSFRLVPARRDSLKEFKLISIQSFQSTMQTRNFSKCSMEKKVLRKRKMKRNLKLPRPSMMQDRCFLSRR